MFGIHRPVKKESMKLGDLPFTLLRSSRKTVALQLNSAGELIVRAPHSVSNDSISRIIQSRLPWILEKREALQKANEDTDLPESHYFDGALFPLHNGRITLRLDEDPAARNYTVTLQEGYQGLELRLRGSSLPPEICKMLVARWGRKYAGDWFRDRVDAWASRIGVTYRSLYIKETRTRWGSCSSIGNINLHWKLIMLSDRLSDYIIVHELCHRIEMNHSKAFWQAVEAQIPDCAARRKELRAIEKKILNW
ncbi:MAG: M48 family metallopeptidase [Lachnospiraceae bacterium]|nr:M48 family metallopeptidase [Lachnospiraceae bacterium]